MQRVQQPAIIALLRKQKGLSQKKLSELSGVSVRDISRLEVDRYLPSEEEAEQLAEALGVDAETISWPQDRVCACPQIEKR